MKEAYFPQEIEKRWQEKWEKDNADGYTKIYTNLQ